MGHIDSVKLRRFIKHISIAVNKRSEIESKREILETQLKKLSKTPKGSMQKEIAKLRHNILEVLQAERQLIGAYKEGVSTEKELEQTINLLKRKLIDTERERDRHMLENKKKIDEISLSLLVISETLNNLAYEKQERKMKVEKLEGKFNAQSRLTLKDKIRSLEQKAAFLKKKGITKAGLNEIKKRIELLKSKL